MFRIPYVHLHEDDAHAASRGNVSSTTFNPLDFLHKRMGKRTI